MEATNHNPDDWPLESLNPRKVLGHTMNAAYATDWPRESRREALEILARAQIIVQLYEFRIGNSVVRDVDPSDELETA